MDDHYNNTLNGSWTELSVTPLPVSASVETGLAKLYFPFALIVANLSCIPIIMLSKRMKSPLKLLLLNLTVSDIMFLVAATVHGGLHLIKGPYNSVCIVIVIVMPGTLTVSYTITVGLAVHNFVAVAKPFMYRNLVTTAKVSLFTSFTLVTAYSFSALVQILSRSTSKFCILLSILPRFSLAFTAIYCLLCCIAVAVLNIWVAAKVRSLRVTAPRSQVNEAFTETGNGRTKSEDTPLESAQRPSNRVMEVSSKSPSYKRQHKTNSYTVKKDSSRPSESAIFSLSITPYHPLSAMANSNIGISSLVPVHQLHSVNGNTASFSSRSPSFSSDTVQSRSDFCQDPHGSNKFLVQQGTSYAQPVNSHATSATSCSEWTAPPPQSTRWQSTVPNRRRAVVTLAIFAVWNAFITLPVLCFWLWIAFAAEDSAQLSMSKSGRVLNNFGLASSTMNPILCMWRFIEWHKLYQKCLMACQ